VLVLGGTTEARLLAELLDGRPKMAVTTSLAGRTAGPGTLPGGTRSGGFGGADGLAAWLREQRVTAMVDATHPFAAAISAHAAEAAARTGVPLLALRRPGWTACPGDRWHNADSLAQAAGLLPGLGARAFLSTGRQDLAAFAALDLFCLIRCVEAPAPPLPARRHVLLARGPFTLDGERELLREHRIDVLVTKDSGGIATAAKLAAAREASLPVVVVRRPPPAPGVPVAPTAERAAALLETLDPLG
jgi:precorrin-6A/cobalt-precorrin-6A reductase